MSKKILLLTDSLALPRSHPEVCEYEDTWPNLLRKQGYFIHQVSIGGATTTDIVRQLHYHAPFSPDLVVLQVGIVDCAPRFMTKVEQAIVRKIPLIANHIFSLMNRPFVKKVRKISYVRPQRFSSNIQKIIETFGDTKIYFVGILPASEEYEKVLPGVSNRIYQYNKLAEQQPLNLVSTDLFDLKGVMSDHHHLNKYGHKQIFDYLLNSFG